MSKTLKRETFELRFFPMAYFFDHHGALLDALFRDSKTKKKNFEHWQRDQNSVMLYDADGTRSFSVSYQNCIYSCSNPPTANFSQDQIRKYLGVVEEYFGDRLEAVQRVGFRLIQIIPVKNFAELTDRLVAAFVKTDNPLLESLGAKVADLKLFPLVFRHGANKFQITLGPTTNEELKSLWGNDPELPDQALYLDVDYFAVQPSLDSDVVRYVIEFLAKAKDRMSKVVDGATVLAEGA